MKRKTSSAVSRAEHSRLLKELVRVRRVVLHNADLMEVLRKDCATNLRRCGELQAEIDALRKLLSRG